MIKLNLRVEFIIFMDIYMLHIFVREFIVSILYVIFFIKLISFRPINSNSRNY